MDVETLQENLTDFPNSQPLFASPWKPQQHLNFDSKGILVIPCITFALGVVGNSLAIASLVADKYRKVRPHSAMPRSPSRTPSPIFRGIRRTGSSGSNNPNLRRFSSASRARAEIRTPRRRRKDNLGPFRTLVLALLSIDLAGILVTTPVTIHLYNNNTTIKAAGGDALCNYSAFAMMFFGIATMSSLTTMAVERLLCVQFPFYYHNEITPRKANMAVVIVLLTCALFSALPAVGLGKIKPMYPETWCFADWHAVEAKDMVFNYIYGSFGVILIATTVICNVLAVAGLFQMKGRSSMVIRPERRVGIEMQNIIQLIVMTCIYIVCWMPLTIRILVNQSTLLNNGEQDRISIWLAAMNPILDPWVYILLRKSFIKRLFQMSERIGLLCAPVEVENTVKITPPTPVNSINSPVAEMAAGERSENRLDPDQALLPHPQISPLQVPQH